MLDKIISVGQTGADQAVLDAAIALKIPHGGWISKGRLTEAGLLPDRYNLKEMSTSSYSERTEQNVIDSDGTLIVSHGALNGGSELTYELAMKHAKPCLHIDLNQTPEFKAPSKVNTWITEVGIQVLNVAGPRASKNPKIYDKVKKLIESVYMLNHVKTSIIGISIGDNRSYSVDQFFPQSVDDIVEHVIGELSDRDRSLIANLDESELICLDATLGVYLRKKLELWSGNR